MSNIKRIMQVVLTLFLFLNINVFAEGEEVTFVGLDEQVINTNEPIDLLDGVHAYYNEEELEVAVTNVVATNDEAYVFTPEETVIETPVDGATYDVEYSVTINDDQIVNGNKRFVVQLTQVETTTEPSSEPTEQPTEEPVEAPMVSSPILQAPPLRAGNNKSIQLVVNGEAQNILGNQQSNVFFGTYLQSSDGSLWYNNDPIQWRVLKNEGGKLRLLSEYCLDAVQYVESNTSDEVIYGSTWANSTIRSWLNGYTGDNNMKNIDYSTNNFKDNAFDSREYAIVLATDIHTNDIGGSVGGDDTKDKLFFLSAEEAIDTSYGWNTEYDNTIINVERQAFPTSYALYKGVYVSSTHPTMDDGRGGRCFWWLRSPSLTNSGVYNISYSGIYATEHRPTHRNIGVRPAMHVDLKSVLFTSAAGFDAGKFSGSTGVLNPVADNPTNNWELTLLDDGSENAVGNGHGNFKIDTSKISFNDDKTEITVPYSGAVTGEREYISAIVTDSNQNIKYYGRIAKAASGESSVKFDVSNVGSDDKLYVFNEQYNGVGYTDYASSLKDTTYNTLNIKKETVNNKPGKFNFRIKAYKEVEDASEAYAVVDSSDGSLTFFRDEAGKYTEGQVDGTKTYYTNFEKTNNTHGWTNQADIITSVKTQDPIQPINTRNWFLGCKNVTSFDLSKMDTQNVTDMEYMFSGCESVTSLDLTTFNTSNVKDMGYMFNGCKSLSNLDISSFNTANVANMWGMFMNCESLTSLDLSNFDTGKLGTDTSGFSSIQWAVNWMFDGCKKLETLNLTTFDTKNVRSFSQMFSDCQSLKELDLSSFSTQSAQIIQRMFQRCYKLEHIYVSDMWDTSRLTYTYETFAKDELLPNYDPNKWDGDMAYYGGDGKGYLDYKPFNKVTPVVNTDNIYEYESAQKVYYDLSYQFEKDTSEGTYKFKLESGKNIQVKIPTGYKYEVWEVDSQGNKVEVGSEFDEKWKLTSQTNNEGEMTKDFTATFKNESTKPNSLTITKKTVKDKPGEFNFKVRVMDNRTTYSISTTGPIVIQKTKDGHKGGFLFTLLWQKGGTTYPSKLVFDGTYEVTSFNHDELYDYFITQDHYSGDVVIDGIPFKYVVNNLDGYDADNEYLYHVTIFAYSRDPFIDLGLNQNDIASNSERTKVYMELSKMDDNFELFDDSDWYGYSTRRTYSFKLENDKSITIKDIPSNYKYEIWEEDSDGDKVEVDSVFDNMWKLISKENDTGVVDGDVTATFTNEKVPEIYTITYSLNGGKYNGSTADISIDYEEDTVIKIHEAPTREGYKFLYWKGSVYYPGQDYKVTEDHTLTAQWEKITTPTKPDKPNPTPIYVVPNTADK